MYEITVNLHGPMVLWHDGPIKIIADTVAEAIKSISLQLKQFKPTPACGRQRIKVVGYENLDDLFKPLTENITVDVVRAFAGGKNGGFLQILLGAVLVAGGFALGASTLFGGVILKFGAMLLLGGLVQLLSPAPDNGSQARNHYLGAPKNTVAIGTPIPVLYGEDRVYGHFLGFDINARKDNKKDQNADGGG